MKTKNMQSIIICMQWHFEDAGKLKASCSIEVVHSCSSFADINVKAFCVNYSNLLSDSKLYSYFYDVTRSTQVCIMFQHKHLAAKHRTVKSADKQNPQFTFRETFVLVPVFRSFTAQPAFIALLFFSLSKSLRGRCRPLWTSHACRIVRKAHCSLGIDCTTKLRDSGIVELQIQTTE